MKPVQYCARLLALLLLFLPLNSIANNATLSHPHGVADGLLVPSGLVVSQINYFEDAQGEHSAESALQTLGHKRQQNSEESNGQAIKNNVFNIGPTQSKYWLSWQLHNTHELSQALHLLLSVTNRPFVSVTLVDQAGQFQQILNESSTQTFKQRDRDFRYLASSLFVLERDQKATLLINYHTKGSTYLPLSIITPDALQQIQQGDTLNAAIFYSFSLAAIIVFILFGLAMKEKLSAMYGGLFITSLLFIASMEGFAFSYIWPHWVEWNFYAPFVLQYLLSGLGLLVAYKAVIKQQVNHYVISGMLWLAILCFVMAGLSFMLPVVVLSYVGSILLSVMFVFQAIAFASWISLARKRNLVAIVVAVGLAIFVLIMVLLSMDASILPGYAYVYSTRLVFIIVLLAAMATVVAHVSGLRQDHEQSLENELLFSQREAETNKALFEAEQNYSRVKALAQLRQQTLASASHDMRQPLFSLRSTIDSIALNESSTVKQQLHNAFDYLENLCNQYLKDAESDIADENTNGMNEVPEAQSEAQAEVQVEAQVDAYKVSLILSTAARMFEDEALSKGLDFAYHTSSQKITQPPLIVMRIVTNVLSNAVKHTQKGKILMGVRRRATGLSIQILDTGPGMSEEQLELLSNAYEKGPDSTGEGLGLAICKQLATQYGMQLSIRSIAGKGTCCSIEIPS